jgi:hypothetical protein
MLDTDVFCDRVQALVPQWDEWLSVIGEYVEVWCVPSVAHVSYKIQTKVLGLNGFVTLFSKTPFCMCVYICIIYLFIYLFIYL